MRKTLSVLTAVLLLGACSDENSVRTGIFSASTVDWEVAKDPDIPGVTCHVQHISANLSISDPSNMSIACRQSDEITLFDLEKAEIEEPKMIFKESKSIFFKSIKVRRTYDEENQVIVYTAFSTKETSGSFKHAISTVPLYGTEAYRDN